MDDVARRLRVALDMFEVGERMQRVRLQRTYSTASPKEIEDRLRDWLHQRPGAEYGDSSGHPSHRFG